MAWEINHECARVLACKTDFFENIARAPLTRVLSVRVRTRFARGVAKHWLELFLTAYENFDSFTREIVWYPLSAQGAPRG